MSHALAPDINYVGIEETASITKYIFSKLKKLERFYPPQASLKVGVRADKERKSVRENITLKINVQNDKDFIEVKENGYDLYAVIDEAAETLMLRLKKQKEMKKEH